MAIHQQSSNKNFLAVSPQQRAHPLSHLEGCMPMARGALLAPAACFHMEPNGNQPVPKPQWIRHGASNPGAGHCQQNTQGPRCQRAQRPGDNPKVVPTAVRVAHTPTSPCSQASGRTTQL